MSYSPQLNNIEIIRGQVLDIEITVPAGVDISNATVSFGISDGPEFAYEVTLTTSKSGQVITAILTEAKSLLLVKDRQFYSCWVVIAGNPTPVARGYIKISNDSRNR